MMTLSASYFLGVDGGGTQCRARLRAADGRLLGEGRGGPANIRLGLKTAWQNLNHAIDQALHEAGLSRADLPRVSAGLGLAGITNDADIRDVEANAPKFAALHIATDAHVACLGAFSGRDGAILIAGTGSAGYALVAGQGHPVGGWGFEVGDDGSAAGLGRCAVHAALEAHDGIRPATGMTRYLLEKLGGSTASVIAFASTATPRDYGVLAPEIMRFAEAGDEAAVSVVQETCRHVERFLKRLHDLGAPRICLVGGLSQPLRPWLSPWARNLLADAETDATEGAILLAQGAGHEQRISV